MKRSLSLTKPKTSKSVRLFLAGNVLFAFGLAFTWTLVARQDSPASSLYTPPHQLFILAFGAVPGAFPGLLILMIGGDDSMLANVAYSTFVVLTRSLGFLPFTIVRDASKSYLWGWTLANCVLSLFNVCFAMLAEVGKGI